MSIAITDGWGTATGDGTARVIVSILRIDPCHRQTLLADELHIGCLDAPSDLVAGGTRAMECTGTLYAVPLMVGRP